ncbi:MAG: phosphotransferase family protein [Gammaproteobacteria bacterium]|nr:phosphotransferase family protein [Gammaproteobacteria bacterium]
MTDNAEHVADAYQSSVRRGEELPVALIDRWLRQYVDNLTGLPTVSQFTGGASNWTYELRYPERALILRRAPAGTKARGAHDMAREYRIQHAIRPVFPLVPEMIALSDDHKILDSDFYVMEKLQGLIPRKRMPPQVRLEPEQYRSLCHSLLDTLLALHGIDYAAEGLDTLATGAGYTERQITGWTRRYRDARTWNVPRARRVMNWLERHLPDSETLSLVHNDFRFDNIVLDRADPTKIVGVLDWEMATIGNPLMDLGNSLAYWVQSDDDRLRRATRRQPTHLPGMLTREQVIDYYRDHSPIDFDNFAFYEVYGLFRLAAIVQQIYYRFYHGQTDNPAFRHFWLLTGYLVWRCGRIIRNN